MNINKIAAKDAYDWARAEMFFGQGAGTRRKLLSAEIEHKGFKIPGYSDAFNKAFANQNMAEHAIKAEKERKRIDRAAKLHRNARGILTGNKQSLTTSVIVVGTVAYYAHQTGADKLAMEYTKVKYEQAKTWVRNKRTKLHSV